MEFGRLGSTGVSISRIGLGCAAMGGYDYGLVDDRQSFMAVQKALDFGVNVFDTANVYGFGHAEEVLGNALGNQRKQVIVATKVGVAWDSCGRTRRDLSPASITSSLEESLRRLKLDCIPLYQMHWPDPKTPMCDSMEALFRAQEQGKIAHIGICNVGIALLRQIQSMGRVESLQLPFSLVEKERVALMEQSRSELGMSILCYNVLAHGLLSGKYGKDAVFLGTDLRNRADHFSGGKFDRNLAVTRVAEEVGKAQGVSAAQVAIRWVLNSPFVDCALTGVKNQTQIEENCNAVAVRLTEADAMRLAEPPMGEFAGRTQEELDRCESGRKLSSRQCV